MNLRPSFTGAPNARLGGETDECGKSYALIVERIEPGRTREPSDRSSSAHDGFLRQHHGMFVFHIAVLH